jgi:BirA family biotin operon repressor/biotin-[acetyl-CoA-carboxylase] ligase
MLHSGYGINCVLNRAKTMDKIKYLIEELADGNYHSGEGIGNDLGLTRAAVWKLIKTLGDWGIDIESSTKKGYRIPKGLELLDKKKILKYLEVNSRSILQKLEIFDSLPSTNDYLLQAIKEKPTVVHACFAERQTAGKGRRGRIWHSPFGTNIYLSLLWQFEKDLSQLAGLSLVIAVSIINALQQYGIKDDLGLKWPNDILWKNKKLCGILVETRGEVSEALNTVIGVGLNVSMPGSIKEKIDQPWADIKQIISGDIKRNQLAGLILNNLLLVIAQFELQGIAPFIAQWRQFDLTQNKKISLHTASEKFTGIARGINETGSILLEDAAGKIQQFSIGEVSLRLG